MGFPGGPPADEPDWYYSEPYQPEQQPFQTTPLQPPAPIETSGKSRVTAGVLQLVGVLGLVGFGRVYLGYFGIAIAQFVGGLFAGAALSDLVGADWTIPAGPAIVGLVDAALILTGRVRDSRDRPLRD